MCQIYYSSLVQEEEEEEIQLKINDKNQSRVALLLDVLTYWKRWPILRLISELMAIDKYHILLWVCALTQREPRRGSLSRNRRAQFNTSLLRGKREGEREKKTKLNLQARVKSGPEPKRPVSNAKPSSSSLFYTTLSPCVISFTLKCFLG